MKGNVLIYLHGENATGRDYDNFTFNELEMVCPTAPKRNGINSWIKYNNNNNPDKKSVDNMTNRIIKLIKKYNDKKVFLGGSSQGAALAMHIYGLYCSKYQELNGFIGCRSEKLYRYTKVKNLSSPIYFYCGGKDLWDKNDDENDTIKKCHKNYIEFLKNQDSNLDTNLVIITDANHRQMGKLEYDCIKNYFKI